MLHYLPVHLTSEEFWHQRLDSEWGKRKQKHAQLKIYRKPKKVKNKKKLKSASQVQEKEHQQKHHVKRWVELCRCGSAWSVSTHHCRMCNPITLLSWQQDFWSSADMINFQAHYDLPALPDQGLQDDTVWSIETMQWDFSLPVWNSVVRIQRRRQKSLPFQDAWTWLHYRRLHRRVMTEHCLHCVSGCHLDWSSWQPVLACHPTITSTVRRQRHNSTPGLARLLSHLVDRVLCQYAAPSRFFTKALKTPHFFDTNITQCFKRLGEAEKWVHVKTPRKSNNSKGNTQGKGGMREVKWNCSCFIFTKT